MSEYLVIVESPAKAKTIERYLRKKYKVKASMGHVPELPKSQMGVDVENEYEPKYITIRGKGPVLKELKTAAKKAKKIYIAADPDREGEAIAWHLAHGLAGCRLCVVLTGSVYIFWIGMHRLDARHLRPAETIRQFDKDKAAMKGDIDDGRFTPSDFISSITDAARANRLAAVLIGGGALWLLVGNQRLKDMTGAVMNAAQPLADGNVTRFEPQGGVAL